MEHLNVAICGSGPGGLVAALFLRRSGHGVTIYESFDEAAPVGSGLLIQPSGQYILAALGLLDRLKEDAVQIDKLQGFSVPSGRRALDVDYTALPDIKCAYGVHRATLFDLLFQAAKEAGVAFHFSHQVRSVEKSTDGGRYLEFENQRPSSQHDLVVDAMGAGSALVGNYPNRLAYGAFWTNVEWVEQAGLDYDRLDQRYFAAQQMAGILPIGINPENGKKSAALFWSLRHDDVADFRSKGVKNWYDEFIKLWPQTAPFVEQVIDLDQLTFARYNHRTARPSPDRQVIQIGDSWHSTSPQLGQGANMALIDAVALAAAVQGASTAADVRSNYRWYRSYHVSLYQLMSAVFTPLYQSDSKFLPVIRDMVVHGTARHWPARRIIAEIVSGNMGYPLRSLDGIIRSDSSGIFCPHAVRRPNIL